MKWFSEQKYSGKVFSVLLTFLTIYFFFILLPYLQSILSFLSIVLFPFVIAMILYYMFRPSVRLLERKMSIQFAILLCYALIGVVSIFASIFVFPVINDQIHSIVISSESYSQRENQLLESFNYLNIDIGKVKTMAYGYLVNLQNVVIKNIGSIIQETTRFFLDFVAVPFILFYMLKDDRKIFGGMMKWVPAKYRQIFADFSKEIDHEMVKYIFGRALVTTIVSLLLLVSFVSIGLPFPLLLSFICLIFIFIPTIGSFIALIPVLLVGFSTSFTMGLEALFIMGVASSLEGFLITPKVMGTTLQIHPLTIMFILLSGGILFGVLGLVLATPIYALIKTIILYLYRLIHLKKNQELPS